ncbi:MAG: right-handed parallel beta-helix repeat-containing protein, partial [Gemmatimonadaceae bacterium]
DVTIDLGGFVIDGGNVGGDGIVVAARLPDFHYGLAVRNGNAERWTKAGFNLQTSVDAVAENLTASHNDVGIRFNKGSLTACTASANTSIGIQSGPGVISHCNAQLNGTGFVLDSASLSDCNATSNMGVGIKLKGGSVDDCTVTANVGGGLFLDAGTISASSTVRGNAIDFNGGNGITMDSIGSLVESNTVQNSSGSGIFTDGQDNRIRGNTSSRNGGEGLEILGSFNMVDDNSALENADYGIFVGIGVKNTIVRNSATGNRAGSDGANYAIPSGQNAGPVGAAASVTQPWSNTQ